MRIGYLSSYPPLECGIATYCQYLQTAVDERELDTFVIAPIGSAGPGVVPTYQSGSGTFAPDVYNVITQLTPDIVHIQHEYGLFGPHRGMEIIDLVFRLRLIRVPVVITLHTVYERLSEEEAFMLGHLLAECAGIVVHEEYQRQTLETHLGPEIAAKVRVIDHGIREVEPVPDAKQMLGLDGKNVVMMVGYFRPTKGFHKILDFLPEVCERDPNAVLVMAGKTRNIEYDSYRHELIDKLKSSPYSSRIKMFQGQFPQHTFDTVLSAADVVVLPYDVGAQSGVLSQCIAFGRPVVTSKLRAFQNVNARSGAGVSCEEDEYAQQILRILGNPKVKQQMQTNAHRYIRYRGGWTVVAERHEAMYEEIMIAYGDERSFVFFPGETAPRKPSSAETSTQESPTEQAPSSALPVSATGTRSQGRSPLSTPVPQDASALVSG